MTLFEILQKQIDEIYGIHAGKKAGSVLIPAFLTDFRKVLEKSDLGMIVSEEYMTEDKKMHIILKGQRSMGASGYEYIVQSCMCNGTELLTEKVPLFSV